MNLKGVIPFKKPRPMETLDVTQIEPKRKHPTIFERFEALAPGEAFVIHNDHDPAPLYYQMLGELGEVFDWEYLKKGPEEWEVKISKLEADEKPSIGDLVAKDYRKAEVFKSYGLDFCCGGKKKPEEAAKKKGVDPEELEKELEALDRTTPDTLPSQDPLQWSLDYLVTHIENTHHPYVREAIPFLNEITGKIRKVHGDNHPELVEINDQFRDLAEQLEIHLRNEEEYLFPYIRNMSQAAVEGGTPEKTGNFSTIRELLDSMEKEHDAAGNNMKRIEQLSSNFTLPEDACASYQVAYQKLREFRDDLERHVHLENNILFPQAEQMEEELKGEG